MPKYRLSFPALPHTSRLHALNCFERLRRAASSLSTPTTCAQNRSLPRCRNVGFRVIRRVTPPPFDLCFLCTLRTPHASRKERLRSTSGTQDKDHRTTTTLETPHLRSSDCLQQCTCGKLVATKQKKSSPTSSEREHARGDMALAPRKVSVHTVQKEQHRHTPRQEGHRSSISPPPCFQRRRHLRQRQH